LVLFRLEVLLRQERSILTPIASVDSVVDQTSTSKREEMPNQVVVHTPRREDTIGQQRPSEEIELVLEDLGIDACYGKFDSNICWTWCPNFGYYYYVKGSCTVTTSNAA